MDECGRYPVDPENTTKSSVSHCSQISNGESLPRTRSQDDDPAVEEDEAQVSTSDEED